MMIANPGAAMMQGLEMGNRAGEMRRGNALQQLYQTQGAQIAAGDQNALAALARFSPQEAMAIQQQHTQAQYQEEDREMQRRQMQMAIEKHAASMSAAERAALAEDIKGDIAFGMALPDAASWDAAMADRAPELVGRFAEREALANEYMGLAEAVERFDAASKPEDRPIIKGADGYQYYQDTQERVLPNVQAPQAAPLTDAGKYNADIRAGHIDPNTPAPVDFETEQKLRKEFVGLPAVKDFSAQTTAYGRIRASASDPSAAGDLAMIFNYMKLLDPGSVVREGEFATAEAAGGVDDRIRNTYNRVLRGERLSPEQRSDFVNRSERLYQQAQNDFGSIESQYRSRAEAYGLDPERSVIDFRTSLDPFQAPPEGPAVDLSTMSDEELMRRLQ
jgi:hypothetical protein